MRERERKRKKEGERERERERERKGASIGYDELAPSHLKPYVEEL